MVKSAKSIKFTEFSGDVTATQAFQFARDHNSKLQTFQDAIAMRIKFDGTDHTNGAQWTRTGAIYVPEGKKVYVAFDDLFLEEFEQRGYEGNDRTRNVILSVKDMLITDAIERAQDTKRFVEVKKQGKLEIALSAVGKDKIIVAAAQDMAEPYAAYLARKGYSKIKYCLSKPTLNKENVGIQPIHLNAYDELIDARYCLFHYYVGYARCIRNPAESRQ